MIDRARMLVRLMEIACNKGEKLHEVSSHDSRISRFSISINMCVSITMRMR